MEEEEKPSNIPDAIYWLSSNALVERADRYSVVVLTSDCRQMRVMSGETSEKKHLLPPQPFVERQGASKALYFSSVEGRVVRRVKGALYFFANVLA